MPINQTEAISASVLLWEEMKFLWTMATFFKKDFEFGTGFKIPYMFIIEYLRDYRHKVNIYCGHGNDCAEKPSCTGHKFLFFLETVERAIFHGVENEKLLYRFWYFDNLKFTKMDDEFSLKSDLHLKSWDFIPIEPRCLKDKTYSQRMSLLR